MSCARRVSEYPYSEIANSIILPHAIRFNAAATASQLIPAAEVMGISMNEREPVAIIEEMAQKIFDLIGLMNLPQHLREVGVKESDLATLAQIVFKNRTVQNNPKPITDYPNPNASQKRHGNGGDPG